MKRDTVREKLLVAAETVFERHGFEKTTLEDLGREAGLNKTSLYYYYPNKEEIFSAVLHRQFDAFLLVLEAKINKKKNGKNAVKSYMENRNSVLKKFTLLSKLHYDSAYDTNSKIEEKEIAYVYDLIAKGIKNGELRKSADKAAHIIVTALDALKFHKDSDVFGELLWDGIGKKKREVQENTENANPTR